MSDSSVVNVVECGNCHKFYDLNKYSDACPFCHQRGVTPKEKKTVSPTSAGSFSRKDDAPEKKKGFGGFGWKKKNDPKTVGGFEKIPVANVVENLNPSIEEEPIVEVDEVEKVEGKPAGAFNPIPKQETFPPEEKTSPKPNDFPNQEKVEGELKKESKKHVEASEKDSTLMLEMEKVSNNMDGRTIGAFSRKKKSTEVVETTQQSVVQSNEPVVAWLVCVEGQYFGVSFNVYAGRNSIGRNTSNHIVIPNEATISKEKHAWITYEPKKREYYLQSGESSGLTYLNGDMIMEPKKVKIYDTIELGDSKFVFVPLCGKQFTWEDYLDKE